MLTRELLSQTLPAVHLHDKVYQALLWMNENHVTHLPVADEGKYLGLISEADLLGAANDDMTIGGLQPVFADLSVKEDEHFLKAVGMAADSGLSIVPVVNGENDLIGSLSYNELLKFSSDFMSLGEPGGLIVLEMEGNQYSFNEINKLVENHDARITQLNTSTDPETGLMQLTIRINKPEVSDLVTTFQRYEYPVKYFFGEELYTNELKSNYDNLMNYLKI